MTNLDLINASSGGTSTLVAPQLTDSGLRSAARRAGYALRKSRRALSMDNIGGYMIVDAWTNFIVYGANYELWPEDVIEFLKT